MFRVTNIINCVATTATLKRNDRGPTQSSFLPPWQSISCSTPIFSAPMFSPMISFVSTNRYVGLVVSDDAAGVICYGACGVDGAVDVGGFGSDANGAGCSAAGAERNVAASSVVSGTAAGDTLRGAVVRTPGGGQLHPYAADEVEAGHPDYAVARLPRLVAVAASCATARRGPGRE